MFELWQPEVLFITQAMIAPALTSADMITLLGGGMIQDDTFQTCFSFARQVVAADGAARFALDRGIVPRAVIGDFDSLDPETRAKLPQGNLVHVSEQDSTDFEKCLTRIDAPLILGVGFMGARLDHELAVYTALVRHPTRRCVIVGAHDICVLAPPAISLETEVGARVSLYPLSRVQGTSTGLKWPLDGIEFSPDGRIGTSNEASGATVRLAFDTPGMLLILPRDALSMLISALSEAPHWDHASGRDTM